MVGTTIEGYSRPLGVREGVPEKEGERRKSFLDIGYSSHGRRPKA
jgi:hypothetical protein